MKQALKNFLKSGVKGSSFCWGFGHEPKQPKSLK